MTNAAMSDLIFAAIESHRKAEAAYIAAIKAQGEDEENYKALGNISFTLLAALLPMTPTSVAGCAAMLRHVAEYLSAYDENLFEGYRCDVMVPASTLLTRIAGTLDSVA